MSGEMGSGCLQEPGREQGGVKGEDMGMADWKGRALSKGVSHSPLPFIPALWKQGASLLGFCFSF